MTTLFSFLVFALLSSFCFGKWIDPQENYDAAALVDELNKIEEFERRGVSYATKPDVCFEDIGCFSKSNGPFHFIDVQPESPEVIGTTFYLYTKHNKEVPQKLNYLDANTLTTGIFDGSKSTVVICHGFNENAQKDWNLGMKDIILKKMDLDLNVILLDWGKGAILPFYGQAVVNSEVVGRELARLLELLHERRGLNIETTYVLGYSLGAHLAGFAGKTIIEKLGKKLGRITGMDPAGPIFESHNASVHLSTEDAHFVDIIHTSTGGNLFFGELGIEKAIGHVDFYPNGGKNQPGCGIFSLVCSHRRSVELYSESLNPSNCHFKSLPCKEGYDAFVKKQCSDQLTSEQFGIMGYQSVQGIGGSLYLTTNNDSPFCRIV